MLYKKYHRNYVKQFKKGAKIVLDCLEFVVDSSPFVTMNPFYSLPTTVIAVGLCRLVDDKCKCCHMVLVYSNGLCRVVQEIS